MQFVSYSGNGGTTGYRSITFSFAPTIVSFAIEHKPTLISTGRGLFNVESSSYGSVYMPSLGTSATTVNQVFVTWNNCSMYKSSDGKTLYVQTSGYNVSGYIYIFFGVMI